MPKLTVIIPARNEEKRIAVTINETDAYLEKQNYDYEILFVDSGSTDGTVAEVEAMVKDHVQNARVVKSIVGKGNAVKDGMAEAKGDYVIFMDADNATPISEIGKFWPHFDKGFSVVIGSRYLKGANVTHKQPFYRIVLSRMANLLIQLLAVRGVKDTQLGFKMFTHEAAKDIFPMVSIPGWGFDMEVLTIARLHHFKIKEVPVLWREFGGSHVPLKAYVQSLRDLLKIKLRAISGAYKVKPSKSEARV